MLPFQIWNPVGAFAKQSYERQKRFNFPSIKRGSKMDDLTLFVGYFTGYQLISLV
jgi:hypothetical protein